MSKQKILFYCGLPGSGKSTDAKRWVDKDPTNRVRVNKDDIRNLLYNGKYSKGNENQVLATQDFIILDSLKRGKSIAFDNTHLVNKHLARLKNLLRENDFSNVKIEIKDFTNVSPEECIKRDLQRNKSVGQDLIWRMYWDHVAVIDAPITLQQVIDNPTAVIVDMDGTLAEMDNRHPFEWDKVGQDKLRTHVAVIVELYRKQGVKIIIVTGRDGCAEEESRKWLNKNGVGYDDFFIRPPGDSRKDYVIKREIYENNIKPHYNVVVVLDDRPQVIREWRRLGLNVINVNPIDRDF